MNRKETTEFLGELLEQQKFRGIGKYWAKEVTFDYGHRGSEKRVDYVQFKPARQCSISDIEKGEFICYEVKSCMKDVYSGNGLNFFGERNYIVTTMSCYKELLMDINSGKFLNFLHEKHPESSDYFGILVAVPKCIETYDEFASPTEILKGTEDEWHLVPIWGHGKSGLRKRSLSEMLFCMLRSQCK